MFDEYPSHEQTPVLKSALSQLVLEYAKLWQLALEFADYRIVAPGPIASVQNTHYHHCVSYSDDCLTYFQRFIVPGEFAWQGTRDVEGLCQTVEAYQERHKNGLPEIFWKDFVRIYHIVKPKAKLRIVH